MNRKLYYEINCYHFGLSHGILLRSHSFDKMNLFIFLVLSFLYTVFSKSVDIGSSNIIKLIANDSECGFSNTHFIDVLDLNDLCYRPLLNSEGFRKTLSYESTYFLCVEYYLVNLHICNLTKDKSFSLKNVFPKDKNGVTDVLNALRGNFSNVDKFCSYTRNVTPTFLNLSTSDSLKQYDDTFREMLKNETTCRELCQDRRNNNVTDFCNVITWVYEKELTSKTIKVVSNEPEPSNIEKINPEHGIHPDTKILPSELGNNVKTPETPGEKPLRTDDNLRSPSNVTDEKFRDQSGVQSDANIRQTLESNEENQNADHLPVDKVKVAELGNAEENVQSMGKQPPSLSHFNPAEIMDSSSSLRNIIPKFDKEPSDKQNKNEKVDNINNEFGKENLNDNPNNSNDDGNINIGNSDFESNYKPDEHDTPPVEDIVDNQDTLNKKPELEEQTDDILMTGGKLPQEGVDMNVQGAHSSPFRGGETDDSHFFTYFASMGIVCGIIYILFHNKKKIVALAVEGRRGRPHGGGRRRPNTAAYSKLDSNLEEAMVSNVSQASVTHVLY